MMNDPAESTLLVAPDDSAPLVVSPAQESLPIKRRADVDAKQKILARIINDMQCEGAVLLMPAHVSWFTGGMTVQGYIADGERPGIYTNGIQRFLVSSCIDSLRIFEEELDGLGFQLKEWQWSAGRGSPLGDLIAGKRIAVDRPYPNLPLINEKLRSEIRILTAFEHEQLKLLGRILVQALESTALEVEKGDSEADIAGALAHRLIRRGVNPEMLSVTADERSTAFRRTGFTNATIQSSCCLQATAMQNGLHATASRTVSLGPISTTIKNPFTEASKLSAVYRAIALPGQTMATANDAGKWLFPGTQYEYEWRLSQPGYGTGRLAAEELRRLGQDEQFIAGQAIVWQAKIGSASIVDTVIISPEGLIPITPPIQGPYKRIKMKDKVYDIPDILVKN
jgi:Xaa-Pro dipeptidase